MVDSLKNIYLRQCLDMIEALDFVEAPPESGSGDISAELMNHLDVAELKRTLHTIKGGAAALNYQIIQIFAQQGEALVEHEKDLHRTGLILLQIKEMLLREYNLQKNERAPTLNNQTQSFSLELKNIFEELARKAGKRVQVEVVDEKGLLPNLKNDFFLKVLFPVLINAIDHGIETEKERLQSNKYFIAQIRIQLTQDKEILKILFSDDGRGNLANSFRKNKSDKLKTHPSVFSGSGLGLQILSEYLIEKQGVVTLDSVSGRGSYIRIEIPTLLLHDSASLHAA